MPSPHKRIRSGHGIAEFNLMTKFSGNQTALSGGGI
jgi:hypothetical protein